MAPWIAGNPSASNLFVSCIRWYDAPPDEFLPKTWVTSFVNEKVAVSSGLPQGCAVDPDGATDKKENSDARLLYASFQADLLISESVQTVSTLRTELRNWRRADCLHFPCKSFYGHDSQIG